MRSTGFDEERCVFQRALITNMAKYLKLYKTFIKNCLIRELEFRLNFIIHTVVFFSYTSLAYISVFLIYGQVDNIGNWNRDKMLLLVTVASFSNALIKMTLHQNINNLPDYIRKGDMDFLLSKPVNTRFLVSTRYFYFEQIPRLIMFFYLVFKFTFQVNSHISGMAIFISFLLILLGIFAMYCLLFIISCIAFWKPRLWNLFAIVDKIQGLADKPADIYKGLLKHFVNILPIAAFATIPTKFLLGEGTTNLLIGAICITIFFFFLSQIVWNLGLRHYESASS